MANINTTTEHAHLDLIYRDSHAYKQGRNDALKGQPCRTDGDVFAGYYISYVAGYDEAHDESQPYDKYREGR
jgi:hypothetical protein